MGPCTFTDPSCCFAMLRRGAWLAGKRLQQGGQHVVVQGTRRTVIRGAPAEAEGAWARGKEYFARNRKQLLWQVPLVGGCIHLMSVSFYTGLSPLQVLEQDLRSTRSAYAIAMICVDYKWSLRNEPNFRELQKKIEERDARLGFSPVPLDTTTAEETLGGPVVESNVEQTIATASAEEMINSATKTIPLQMQIRMQAAKNAGEITMTTEEFHELKKEWQAIRDDVHQRSAERLLWLCRQNAGIFTKAGQHVASLNNILPRQYIGTLAILQDHVCAGLCPSHHPFRHLCRLSRILTTSGAVCAI